MNTKAIWIVYGCTGEYSDHVEWNVCAYPTEELAKRHAELAQILANELINQYVYFTIPSKANQYDAQMSADYTGTHYGYTMVEVFDDLMVPNSP